MGERKTEQYLAQLREEEGVLNLWSWSRIKSSKTDLYSYLLHYIIRVKADDRDNMYSLLGNVVHDNVENMHCGKITREEALKNYKEKSIEFDIYGYKFNRSNANQNETIGKNYHYDNTHFFENFKLQDGENQMHEEFIRIRLGSQLVIGYIDHSMVIDGYLYITDYKTSSIYIKDKFDEEKGQLLLYALGKVQEGYPLEKIRVRWLFTKYVTLNSKMKNGKLRQSNVFRHDIGSKSYASVKMWLKHFEYNDDDIDRFLDTMMLTNSLEHLPEQVRNCVWVEDCYVYVTVTQEALNELKEDLKQQIFKVVKLEAEYNKTKDDRLFWVEVTDSNSYFFQNLCSYNRYKHKPLDEYYKNKESYRAEKIDDDDDDIDMDELLSDLGLV